MRVYFREVAWVNGVSGFSHPFVFFGVFPCVWVFPTPSYHMLCNYHTSFRVTPTTHSLERSLAPPRRSLTSPRLASPSPEATTRKQRDDLDDDQHPRLQPRTLEKPTPAPHKSSTSRQPRRPRRPRRRPEPPPTPSNTTKVVNQRPPRRPRRPRRQPTQPPTPSNMLEHADVPHHRPQRRPASRPSSRPADAPTSSNTRKARTIDTHHGHKTSTSRPRTNHHTTSPVTVAKHTPAKPVG